MVEIKKKYGLTVKRDTVYNILKIADPEGLANRFANRLRRREYLSPGPNFIWHTDGYDKLKPFGFAIHGCIDGFSRMILWLEVATTNNDPKVTAHYFLKTVLQLKFLPTVMRSDKGSENTLMESLQICLRSKDDDQFSGEKSFIKGKSVHNQRIESYWGQMRRHSADFYIQFFKCMVEKNLFDGSKLHKMCLQYCFGPMITKDLEMTKTLWNEHRIRKQPARNNIAGKPFILFELPERVNARNYKKGVNEKVVQRLLEQFTTKPHLICPNFEELIEIILPNVEVASTPEEALELYQKILNRINEYTNES
ncbi:uncharacterized protein LOC127279030 [Leptopilina boulardi]|uniref:uncharacterized protein LOC127279030 n=1 Tax=Leptopilina boulardi TaxID=63433 RepID=UPI0021F59B01|nr:uncharacterized protein LOC127279030 [Leptopilina boulardi]